MNNSFPMNDGCPDHHPEPGRAAWPARRRWMAILARASTQQIDASLAQCATPPPYTTLRGPEAGLVMVRGRAGGGGSPFNLGEMTVTRCTVRTANGFIGHAYIPGRENRLAEQAALIDALMQDPGCMDEIDAAVITPLEAHQAQQKAARAAKAAATRVEFFAMQTMRS